MLEQFLMAVYHPNRVVELVNAISLLRRFGMTGYTDRIDETLLAEQGTEPEVIAGNIERFMSEGIMAAYAQFGVEIEYDPGEISIQCDMLEFLICWDTAEGVSPASYPDHLEIRELGNSNEDILIELFDMAGKNHDERMIDWIMAVSDSLLRRIGESFTQKPSLVDEVESIPAAALSDFRVFAVHFPDTHIVKYVKMGGALGLSMSTLLIKHDEWFMGLPVDQMAVELAGMALTSDLRRDILREEVAKLMEPVLGSSAQGQRLLQGINKTLTKVLGNGDA